MVHDFKTRGVPIDCVGLQSHFNSGNPVPSNYQTNLSELRRAGRGRADHRAGHPGLRHRPGQQVPPVVNACLAVSRCNGITVWGIRDTDSWRPGDTPLLFDGNGNKKAAYTRDAERSQRRRSSTTPPSRRWTAATGTSA